MWETGLAGWQADWRPGSEQVKRHAAALNSLVGTRLTGAWTIWIGGKDWFADMPIVLQFDASRQLEICWQRFDDLSISWETIDIGVEPTAWLDDLSWKPWKHLALSLNKGEAVTSVAATELVLTTRVDDADPTAEATCTGGLWIGTTGPGLHIFNALDENGLSTSHESGL